MDFQNTKHFETDPDWQKVADRHGYQIQTEQAPPTPLDIAGDREAQLVSEGEWSTSHPLTEQGYDTRLEMVEVRDGHKCEVKLYRSNRVGHDVHLPLLYVTHGGGWIQGTYVTEEAWLLWPLLSQFDLVIVSVNYRLAPRYTFPTIVNDSWDVLNSVLERSEELHFDPARLVFGGSSAGGCLSAILSQKARDAKVPVAGVLLNVPITCDPRHFPSEQYEYQSYEQCVGTLLGSEEMRQIWKTVIDSDAQGRQPDVSPLLGNLNGLPPHGLYVAGQDPLRDEGLAYGQKLKDNGVPVELHIYPGVPHTFGEFWELQATKRFWGDIRHDLSNILSQ